MLCAKILLFAGPLWKLGWAAAFLDQCLQKPNLWKVFIAYCAQSQFTVKGLSQAGFSISVAKAVGFTLSQIKIAGEVKAARLALSEIKAAG